MYQLHQFSNGIRIIHKATSSEVAHCGLVINSGSRDEGESEQGLAHFIEHVIFKGTHKRKTHHILSSMENVGGEMNAYTTKEDTCIYASFMPRYYDRWFELLADIITNSTFPEKEIQKEKEVIIDEINSYKDNPGEQIFDDFDDLVFSGHPLGRNILGKPGTLKKLEKKHIEEFILRTYVPGAMVISSVGKLPFSSIVALAEKHFGKMIAKERTNGRKSFNGFTPVKKIVKRRNHQAHCVMGGLAYAADSPQKTALTLLNNLLGGPGLNSRLNMGVREKHGFCYHIESNYHPYSDAGIFTIYFGTSAIGVEKTLALVNKELQRIRTEKLGSLQLKRAKEQLLGQISISLESNLADMLSMGKSLLMFDKVDSMEVIFNRIEAITASELLEVANDVLDPNKFSQLTFLPR